MPLSGPRDSTLAIVGDGFGSLIVYGTAVYLGFRPEQITIYGPSDQAGRRPTSSSRTTSVRRCSARSRSRTSCRPTGRRSRQLDAWSRRSVKPLFRSIRRKYNPGVPDILAEALVVQHQLGWNDNRLPTRVGWLQRENGRTPHFVLYDEEANFIGRAKHVMLARRARAALVPAGARQGEGRIRSSTTGSCRPTSRSSTRPEGRYVVVGAGIASVNEWANALDAGAKVISLLRNPEPDEQDLNTPRCLFEALGIDAFQGSLRASASPFLGKILKGTAPTRRELAGADRAGPRGGPLRAAASGEIDRGSTGPGRASHPHLQPRTATDPGWLDVTGVVAATGFHKSALTVPLLRRLVEHYNLPVEDGRLRLRTTAACPAWTSPESRSGMMGIHANVVSRTGTRSPG